MQAKLYSVNALAVELRRDRRTLARDLEGLPPAKVETQGGRTLRWYYLADVIAHLYVPAAELPEGDEYDDQRQRLAAAQAEKVEHENAIRRGELARKEDVVRFWTDCIAATRARMLRIPSDVGGKVPPELRAVVQDTVREGVYEALRELAEYDPPASKD